MTDAEDRDTLPPEPSEFEAMTFAGQLFGQLDRIEAALKTLTNEVLELKQKVRANTNDIAFVGGQIRKLTPAGGMPAVGNGNGNGTTGHT